jgi:hypothetical protein
VEEVILEAEGHNGHLQLLRDRVRILRRGLMGGLSGNSDQEIPLADISAVDFHAAGRLTNGHLRFILRGKQSLPGDTSSLDSDAYTVIFTAEQRFAVQSFQRRIEQHIQGTSA